MADAEADPSAQREEEEEDPETELLGKRLDQNGDQTEKNTNEQEQPTENNEQPEEGTEEEQPLEGTDEQEPPEKDTEQGGPTENAEEEAPQTTDPDDGQEVPTKETVEDGGDANAEPNDDVKPDENAEAGEAGDDGAVSGEAQPPEEPQPEEEEENNQEAQGETQEGEGEATQEQNPEENDNQEEPPAQDGEAAEDTPAENNETAEGGDTVPDDQPEGEGQTEEQDEEPTEPQDQTADEPETPADEQDKEPLEEPKDDEEEQPKTESPVAIPTATPEPDTDNVGTGTEPTEDKHETDPHAPSPVSRYDQNATATVKFVLMPSGQVATMRCHLGQALGQLKGHFASELKLSVDVILMLFDGKNMGDEVTLGDLGVGPNGTVQLEIQSADPVNQPIKPVQKRTEYHMPDVITVRVQTEDGTMQDVVVEIERALRKKPFLGGYRHKKTGVEYHHASAQTIAKQKPQSTSEKYCRDTQTVQQRHQVQQTTNAMSTQMTKIGVYVSNMEDKLVVPGKYTTASEHQNKMLEHVIIIQKYYRRWLAMRTVEKVREDMAARLEWEREDEIRKRKEKEDRIRREFERRMNPKTREDFDLLYHALEKWRKEEMDRINSTLSGAERKAALCVLLEQETQLVGSIGRHKLDAEGENRLNKIQNFLDKAAAPKRWKGPDGNTTEMDTPYTLRAQQLRDIYNTINMKYLTQDERLDVLLTLKHTVKEHDCKLTQEIVELIDREADLLMRGVKESNLEGLRKRISTLFLQYCKTPVFNPEIARLLKVPQDAASLRSNIYFCSSCNQYLPSTDFQLSSNSDTVGRCKRCLKMDNDSRVRQDYSHYRYMLKALRRSEENYGDDSKIAFLLQESDLRYLVENVWSSQSVLSAWEDLYDLVLVRWDRHSEWSPWNCCLLTKEEASAHEKLEDLVEAYGRTFIHKVKHKHTLARNYFSRLPGMAEHLRREASAKSQASSQGPSISGKAVPIRVT